MKKVIFTLAIICMAPIYALAQTEAEADQSRGWITLALLMGTMVGLAIASVQSERKKNKKASVVLISEADAVPIFWAIINDPKNEDTYRPLNQGIAKGLLTTKGLPVGKDGNDYLVEWLTRKPCFRLLLLRNEQHEIFLFLDRETGDYYFIPKVGPKDSLEFVSGIYGQLPEFIPVHWNEVALGKRQPEHPGDKGAHAFNTVTDLG